MNHLTTTFGPFELAPCGTLRASGKVVPLTPKEEAVLRVLVDARGERVGKDALLERAWPDTFVFDTSLTRCIHTLRRKLSAAAEGIDCIRTSYGRGYQLAVDVRIPDEPPVGTRRPAGLQLTPSL